MELRSAVRRSRAATNGRARNHRQRGNTWLAADPSAAIASRSACAGFDRTRRVCGNFWRRGRRILVTRMRLPAGLESILQEANLRWFVVDAHGLLFGTPRPCRATYAPVIHQRDQQPSHAIETLAAKSGVRRKAILATQFTGILS